MSNIFDENEAISFIKSNLGSVSMSDDDILDIIDSIYDYYDENGELDLDFEDDTDGEDSDCETIAAYVAEQFQELDPEIINKIVKAELEYENSLL